MLQIQSSVLLSDYQLALTYFFLLYKSSNRCTSHVKTFSKIHTSCTIVSCQHTGSLRRICRCGFRRPQSSFYLSLPAVTHASFSLLLLLHRHLDGRVNNFPLTPGGVSLCTGSTYLSHTPPSFGCTSHAFYLSHHHYDLAA
jgi:hypothetical protein